MPFQVLHLYQLKIFGSFAENACSEVNLLASEASIIIMIQVRSYKGLCDEQKIMIEPPHLAEPQGSHGLFAVLLSSQSASRICQIES